MSQNGSDCLSKQSRGYGDILRFYYGADIELAQAMGGCVTAVGSDGGAVDEREFRSLPEDRRICRCFFYDRRDRGECTQRRIDDDCK